MTLRENWPPPSYIKEQLKHMKRRGELPPGMNPQDQWEYVRGEIRDREERYIRETDK